ncbi:hypothetical protein BT93_K1755 [Corymbia citriodora subsp. variegata]|nr:hypothetical protein BT93_K1755 [Corymbia citriodora subsp. variegata]
MRRIDDCRERAGASDQQNSDDEAVDRISGLPDSLLLHILSFLPIRYAVRTSLILRPFRGLWRSLGSLSFEECDFHSCYRCRPEVGCHGRHGFSNFVDHVLALHESCQIDRFRIELDFHDSGSINSESEGYNSEVANRLDKWIFFALKKKVKVLDIALVGCGEALKASPASHYRMTGALFNNRLVELCLDVCNLESLGQIQLESLRKLSLWDVNLSDEVMCNLILGSPSLKKVSLEDCHGLQVLKIDSHPSLEELNVCICHGLKEIELARSGIKILAIVINYSLMKIACLNVVTLELDGSTKGMNISCGSSVIDMALYIRSGFKGVFQEYPEVKTLLEKVQNATYFTLCNWSVLGKKWEKACKFDGRRYWNSIEGTFYCLKHHLKNVMIYACVTEPYVIELIEFLLGNALILEKMVISTKRNTGVTRNGESHYFDVALEEDFDSEMLVEFSKKVFSFPRISPSAVVHFD